MEKGQTPDRAAGWSVFGLIRLITSLIIWLPFIAKLIIRYAFNDCTILLLGTKTVAQKDGTDLPYATLLHSWFEMLLSSKQPSTRCHQCAKYRNTLSAIASQKRSQDTIHRADLTSHMNYCYLTYRRLRGWRSNAVSSERPNCSVTNSLRSWRGSPKVKVPV